MKKRTKAKLFALTAALLYGIQVPFSKLLEEKLDTLFLAAFLYLGAGIGMLAVRAVELLAAPQKKEAPLGRKDLPFVILMILLDIAAPILLLTGLRLSSAGTVSLLGNFEIAATAGAWGRAHQCVLRGRPFRRRCFVMACLKGKNNMDISHGAASYGRRNGMRHFRKTQSHACSPV